MSMLRDEMCGMQPDLTQPGTCLHPGLASMAQPGSGRLPCDLRHQREIRQ